MVDGVSEAIPRRSEGAPPPLLLPKGPLMCSRLFAEVRISNYQFVPDHYAISCTWFPRGALDIGSFFPMGPRTNFILNSVQIPSLPGPRPFIAYKYIRQHRDMHAKTRFRRRSGARFNETRTKRNRGRRRRRRGNLIEGNIGVVTRRRPPLN